MSVGPPAAAVGSEAAARFEAELRRYIRRRVPGPDADDVLQEALIRVYRGAGALRAQERLAPWIYRVARSVIVDHYRRAAVRGGQSSSSSRDEQDATETEVDDPPEAVRALLSACIEPFLAGLPPEQSEAIRLTDLGGLTQREAAERVGIAVPTLKARVQRGRRQLRASFEECCAFERDSRGVVVDAEPRCGCG